MSDWLTSMSVYGSISDRRQRVWRTEALVGTKATQANCVECGRATMTLSDVPTYSSCLVHVIAAARPAEFIILRIGLCAGYSKKPYPIRQCARPSDEPHAGFKFVINDKGSKFTAQAEPFV